jgi:hypothetical protein
MAPTSGRGAAASALALGDGPIVTAPDAKFNRVPPKPIAAPHAELHYRPDPGKRTKTFRGCFLTRARL